MRTKKMLGQSTHPIIGPDTSILGRRTRAPIRLKRIQNHCKTRSGASQESSATCRWSHTHVRPHGSTTL